MVAISLMLISKIVGEFRQLHLCIVVIPDLINLKDAIVIVSHMNISTTLTSDSNCAIDPFEVRYDS